MVRPPIHWMQGLSPAVVKKTLSDIEFLAKKEFDGKLVTDEGTRTTTGDIATLTANTGKDMYLAKAKFSIETTNTGIQRAIVELKVNAVIKATASVILQAGAGTTVESYEFITSGLKVIATQIIKIEAITLQTGLTINGELVCFEETTGETPVI